MAFLSLAFMQRGRIAVVATFWFLSVASIAVAQHTIDFTQGTNLKQVYDAGLRPWRFRADETGTLHLTDETIGVIPPTGTPFQLDVRIATFGILTGNELASADFISANMPIAQAVSKAREVCAALGIDVTTGMGMEGLGEKGAQLEKLGSRAPAPQYWNGRNEKGRARYSVTVNPLFGWDKVQGTVEVHLEFYELGKPMKSLTEPIKPPPGYEHLSMEPPETHPKKPFPDPAYDWRNMIKSLEKGKAAGSETPSAPTQSASPANSLNPHEETLPAVPSKSGESVWWVAGVAVLLGIVGLVWKHRG